MGKVDQIDIRFLHHHLQLGISCEEVFRGDHETAASGQSPELQVGTGNEKSGDPVAFHCQQKSYDASVGIAVIDDIIHVEHPHEDIQIFRHIAVVILTHLIRLAMTAKIDQIDFIAFPQFSCSDIEDLMILAVSMYHQKRSALADDLIIDPCPVYCRIHRVTSLSLIIYEEVGGFVFYRYVIAEKTDGVPLRSSSVIEMAEHRLLLVADMFHIELFDNVLRLASFIHLFFRHEIALIGIDVDGKRSSQTDRIRQLDLTPLQIVLLQ